MWITWWGAWSAIFVIATGVEVAGAYPDSGGVVGGILLAILTAALAAARVVVDFAADAR